MATLRKSCAVLFCCLAWLGAPVPLAHPAAPTGQQVKAVFIFNFSHFVEWPAGSLGAPAEPFVIGLLGGEEVARPLGEVVRGERVDGHPMQVRRYRSIEEIGDCRILFIGQAEGADVERIVERLNHRDTLTVSDLDGASRRGVMIELANEERRIRPRINVDAAQAAGVVISSNLLRLAEIIRTGN